MARENSRPSFHTKGAPDYDSADFWDARFAAGRDVGEWLNSGDMLIGTIMAELSKAGTDEQPRVLHLGQASRSWGRSSETLSLSGGGGEANVDFSREAVRQGKVAEQQEEPARAMHWHCADLLQWDSVAELSAFAPFQVVLDKSTSDAIATGNDRHFNRRDDPAGVCPLVQDMLSEIPTLVLSPVELLALHLATLTHKGSTWVALSYSTFRFDGLHPVIAQFWKVRSRTGLKAPSGPVHASTHTPDVYHRIYILDRI
ncbi:hypothetical protein N7470_003303 [Penicillium chermesinum]|nr:hypothetical protein N7470_003303 [Penicillium chermesinum]